MNRNERNQSQESQKSANVTVHGKGSLAMVAEKGSPTLLGVEYLSFGGKKRPNKTRRGAVFAAADLGRPRGGCIMKSRSRRFSCPAIDIQPLSRLFTQSTSDSPFLYIQIRTQIKPNGFAPIKRKTFTCQ